MMIMTIRNSDEPAMEKKPKLEKKKLLRGPEISLLDLNNKSLQAVYNGEQDELAIELDKHSQINDGGKQFKYTLTM